MVVTFTPNLVGMDITLMIGVLTDVNEPHQL